MMHTGSVDRQRLEALDPRFRDLRWQRARETVLTVGKIVVAFGMFVTAIKALEKR